MAGIRYSSPPLSDRLREETFLDCLNADLDDIRPNLLPSESVAFVNDNEMKR